MTTPQDSEDWKEEFREKFYTKMGDEEPFLDNGYYYAPDENLGDKIIDFISSLLLSQKEAMRKRMTTEIKEKLDKIVVMPFMSKGVPLNLVDNDDLRASLLGEKPDKIR